MSRILSKKMKLQSNCLSFNKHSIKRKSKKGVSWAQIGRNRKLIGKVKNLELEITEKNSEKAAELEIELEKYQLINSSKELPFEIKDNINEDTRYRYRYLDLRRPSSKQLLLIKNQFCYELRNFLHKREFIEIETPILANSSPEGADGFVVPANFPHRYYTLPQSPQIFKQLLMVGGFNKYYQIAKSFRNEGARSNRQIEFLQLDLEISLATPRQIQRIIEKLLKSVLGKVFNLAVKIPFPTLTYSEVIKKYGTDKPDLRPNPTNKEALSFCWITHWPLFEYNPSAQKYESFRHPFTIPQRKYIQPFLNNKIKPEKIMGETFDLVCNGEEILSGGARIYTRELQEKVLEILGYNSEEREKYFGYFLQALEFAAPPHGGIGLGIDRLLAVILNISNLKELIAFPKNIDGTCSLTKTPDFINNKQRKNYYSTKY